MPKHLDSALLSMHSLLLVYYMIYFWEDLFLDVHINNNFHGFCNVLLIWFGLKHAKF